MRSAQSWCRLGLGVALGLALPACHGSDGEVAATGGGAGAPSGGSPAASAGTGGASGAAAGGGGLAAGAGGGETGGAGGSGGSAAVGGSGGAGGSATAGSGGDLAGGTGGVAGSGGAAGAGPSGGRGGRGNGGRAGDGAGGARAGAGGSGATSTGGSAGTGTGTCTKSQPTGKSYSGSGTHDVVVETNADPGIVEGTIYRPADLGGSEKYPIFVWGEGGCSENGLSNSAAMAEIASHGYFVIADGTPGGSGNRGMDRSMLDAMGAPLLAYVDFAVAENEKPCSAYYQALDTTKIAANGFSCGGLMSQGTVKDPRIVTWGVTSSGMAGAGQDFYDLIHTPVFFVEGGTSDIAYDGGLEGYQAIAKLEVPVMWFSKDLGHGGDLSAARGGDFTKLNLAWLNWWLKGDETATGKGMLVGSSCSYCTDSAWDVMSAHLP